MDKVVIPLEDGYHLIIEKNAGEFDKEVYVGIENPQGKYIQDLAIVRPTYKFKDDAVKFDSDRFEVLIFADHEVEDFTNKFTILRRNDDE